MKKPFPKKPSLHAGFALIATILLMVLLAIITVGTLSLSVVTLRNGNQDSAQNRARANARMALMIAIGELQNQMGPDQRISANSDILNPDSSAITHRHWTGAWNSWKAGDGESSQHSTIQGITDDMAPTYLPNRNDYFRKWLVSLNDTEAASISSPLNLSLQASNLPSSDDDAIFLVSEGSLGKGTAVPADFVAARLLDIKDLATSQVTGRYSWWVGDESQKARIMDDSYAAESSLTSAEKIYRGQAPASTGTSTAPGLKTINDDTQLAALPSLATLDLVTGATGRPAQENFYNLTPFSYAVLSDVREGGLKRDLSTLLEQPIRTQDDGPEYMLYSFDDPRFSDPGRSNSRVPIQDLAAYYQLYDDDPSWSNNRREGVRYDSPLQANSIQVRVPDYDGATKNVKKLSDEYTALYRQPVVTKIQFMLGLGATEILPEDRAYVASNPYIRPNGSPFNRPLIRDEDTHKLQVGVMPMITLWNPYNVPLVMDSPQILRVCTPSFALRWRKYRTDGMVIDYPYMNINFLMHFSSSIGVVDNRNSFILRMRFANTPADKVVFSPGEVKVFSIPSTNSDTLNDRGNDAADFKEIIDPVNAWDPSGFLLAHNSCPTGYYNDRAPHSYRLPPPTYKPGDVWEDHYDTMVFNASDRLAMEIRTERTLTQSAGVKGIYDGAAVSWKSETSGACFQFYMRDADYEPAVISIWNGAVYSNNRNHQMLSRYGSDRDVCPLFNEALMKPAFPGGVSPIDFQDVTNAMPASQIIGASNADEVVGLMEFSLNTGCEVNNSAVGGYGGGRRISSRPFLHSSNAYPFIDQADKASLYNYGWDWRIDRINNVEDSSFQAIPGTGNGFYGGGYSVEAGSTHVIQREIPVLPPISIASFSHAQLGGFSLARNAPGAAKAPLDTSYQVITATGQGGLAPQVMQAIGNSYAHPNVPAAMAKTTRTREFSSDLGPVDVPFVDHSYLANKALWDEFFFSSITPQPSKVELFEGSTLTAKQVAEKFFIADEHAPLPNRRMTPSTFGMDQNKLDDLFAEAGIYNDGMADKIAAHLMVEGAFNINSTSVVAWKALLSSMKGKAISYYESGKKPSESVPAGVSFSQASLSNAVPVKTSDISGPNLPPEQWTAGRELSDDEIQELAEAIVKQVKQRGPFLSMSEFINRRLEGDSTPEKSARSSKGALQAALDDENVSINANFRAANRKLDNEVADIEFAFKDAAKGPIAYGSSAYVDQADVLRNFAEQLTPRGDTFVIRSYGDSLDKNGKVEARAWCEAVVQRTPDYIDSRDESHVKQGALTSSANRKFGRMFKITQFRWLNDKEI